MKTLNKKIYQFSIFLAVVFAAVSVWTLSSGSYLSTTRYMIGNVDTLSAGETVSSSWVEIGPTSNVALYYWTDDTSNVKFTFHYRFGSLDSVNSLGADSINITTTGTAAVGKGTGLVLRGYGLATDKIPGANNLKVTAYCNGATGVESSVKVRAGLITNTD